MTVKTMKRIFSYTAKYRKNFVLAVIFAVIGVAGSLLVPILTGRAIDHIVGKNDVHFEKILRILITLALSVVISSISQWIMAKNSNILSSLTARDIRDQYLEKLSRVPVGFVDSRSRGDLISRASVDIETVSDALTQGFTQFLTGIVTIAGTLIFMMCIDLKIALIVIVLTPLSLAAAWIITKLTHNAFTDQSTVRGNLSGLADEMIKNQNLVEAFDYTEKAE
ncbi:MAG: ABC transporter ATP-binding protein, partial [Oscillospiraceae bacterium]|nr:ABC transporter ATP-binding protein [Oscillospiraceae bacterium]